MVVVVGGVGVRVTAAIHCTAPTADLVSPLKRPVTALPAPSTHHHKVGVAPRQFVEAAQPKQQVLQRVTSAVLGEGPPPHLGVPVPAGPGVAEWGRGGVGASGLAGSAYRRNAGWGDAAASKQCEWGHMPSSACTTHTHMTCACPAHHLAASATSQ